MTVDIGCLPKIAAFASHTHGWRKETATGASTDKNESSTWKSDFAADAVQMAE
jgi:hypothetical protein